MHFDQQAVNTLPHEPKPRPIPGFKITRGVLRAMGPVHRMAAEELIRKGKWMLVSDSENSDNAGAPDAHTCSDIQHGTAQNVYYSIGSAV